MLNCTVLLPGSIDVVFIPAARHIDENMAQTLQNKANGMAHDYDDYNRLEDVSLNLPSLHSIVFNFRPWILFLLSFLLPVRSPYITYLFWIV